MNESNNGFNSDAFIDVFFRDMKEFAKTIQAEGVDDARDRVIATSPEAFRAIVEHTHFRATDASASEETSNE